MPYKQLVEAAYATASEIGGKCDLELAPFTDDLGVTWDNSDIIPGGRLGFAFLLLELYRLTGDPEVRRSIDKEVDWVETCRKDQTAQNYSLFFGRMGISYFFLELFLVTRQREYLEKGLAVVGEYLQSFCYKYGTNSSLSLYNGLSGIMLHLARLYQHTGDDHLLAPIRNHLSILLSSARLDDNGIFWSGVATTDAVGAEFVSGGPGIAFTFHELGKLFGDEAFFQLATAIFKREDAYAKRCLSAMDTDFPATPGFWNGGSVPCADPAWHSVRKLLGIQGGVLGLLLSKIKSNRISEPSDCISLWKQLSPWVFRLSRLSSDGGMPFDLKCLSEFGLVAVEGAKRTKDDSFLISANKIAEIVCGRRGGAVCSLPDLLQSGYFCLKLAAIEHKDEPFLYLPGVKPCSGNKSGINKTGSIFPEWGKWLKRLVIGDNFKETDALLEQLFPSEYKWFLAEQLTADLTAFMVFVANLLGTLPGGGASGNLGRAFQKECRVLKAKMALLGIACHGLTREELDNICLTMQLTGEQLLDCRLVVSGRIIIVGNEGRSDLHGLLNGGGDIIEFLKTYGSDTVICRSTGPFEVHAASQDYRMMVLERFVKPSRIGDVKDQLMGLFYGLDGGSLANLSIYYSVKTRAEVMSHLEALIIRTIEQYLMDGILVKAPLADPQVRLHQTFKI